MNGFFERMKWKFANWMQGRYGGDDLANTTVGVGIILFLIDIFLGTGILGLIALALFIWALFRCLSKNIPARRKELATYERVMEKPKRKFSLWKKMWTNRKTTVYFKCKGCGQILEVPKGKGKLRVVCPKCKTETIKKS